MLLRFWYWLFGEPIRLPLCEHEWDSKEVSCREETMEGIVLEKYTRVTRFCTKCGKLVQYKL